MPHTFAEYVALGSPASPEMPIAHTTDGYFLGRIFRTGVLEPMDCPVYKEKLTYFFYGRPAYRALQTIGPVSLVCASAVSFLVSARMIANPKRLLPFDSGAMRSDKFKDFLHPAMTLKDFEIAPEISEAAKIVDRFFLNNSNYYVGNASTAIVMNPLDAEVQCYHSLISTKSATVADDRRSSIELQIADQVALTSSNLIAVILPEPFMDDIDLVDFISDTLNADIVTYGLYHAPPSHDTRSILDAGRAYLTSKGFLK